MMQANYFRLMIGVASSAILVAAGTAHAQSAPPSNGTSDTVTAPADTEAGTEDIIVTAQRRDESLSKTPVAVSVVSAETLAEAQVTSQQDLRSIAPGLSVRASTNSNTLNYALRGQTLDPLSDTTPGVVPYLNEVQLGGTASAAAFYDLQNVQVLKGPQGTLFGRSATGGAVLFTTAKPSNELGGYVSATGGNYAYRKAEGAINVPIIAEDLLFRAAGVYQRRNGFQRNIFTNGGREGDYERYGLRGSLSANLSSSIHNDLVMDYFKTDGSSTVAVISGLVPFTGTGSPFIPIEFLYAGTATPIARATGIGTIQAFLPPIAQPAVPGFYDAYFAPGSRHPATGITQALADQQARGPYSVNSSGNNVFLSENIIVTNATTFDLDADTSIKNIFGYGHIKSFNASDSDGTPYGISEGSVKGAPLVGFDETTKQVSNELQLLGTTFNERLTYVAGVYYLDQSVKRNIVSSFFDILLGGQRQVNAYILDTRTIAGYAQGTYKLNDNGLAATVGLRYTSERVGKQLLPADSFAVAAPTAPPGFSYDQSTTYKRLSWQFGLQNQISPNTLLYVTTRRAYKSGGYNGTVSPRIGNAASAGDAYAAERVTDVEGGAKFSGRLGDMPTRINVAAYHNWIKNSQRLAFTLIGPNPAALTANVPKGKTYGAELDVAISPAEWLTLGGAANYTHARYSADNVFVNGISQTFDQVPDTPEFTGSLFANVTVPVSGTINVIAHGDVYHQGRTFTTTRSQNNAGAVISSYTLANFRLGVEDDPAGWSLTANLKNAFNRTYYVGGLATGELFQINTLIPGEPRTFTLEARFRF